MRRQAGTTRAAPARREAVHGGWASLRDSLLKLLYRLMIVLVFIVVLTPMAIIIISSFSGTRYFTFPPSGFSVIAYQQLWNNDTLRDALGLSTILGLVTMVLSLLLAGPAAYAIDRFRFAGRDIIQTSLMSPIMLPALMLAIALLMFISALKIPRSLAVLVVGHVLIAAPFALRVLLSSLTTFDRTLEEASASLGAHPLETVRRVTLPILQPGILSAAVLAFVVSFGQVTMSVFLAGEGLTTLPVEIFLITDFSFDVAITAVSVVVMVVALVILTIVELTTGLERMA